MAIALAALLGLLGVVAIDRSQLSPPADRPGTRGTPSTDPRTPSAEGKAKAPVDPRRANRADTPTRTSAPVRSGSSDPSRAVALRSPPPRGGPFGISGIPSGPLAPGLSAWLDLVLTNPNKFAITVRSLTVRVRSISAPAADAGHSCGSQDFTVAQFSGGGLRLRPASTTSLGRLGIARVRWPRVGMPDRAVNQDGCKGASLTLDYRGVSR